MARFKRLQVGFRVIALVLLVPALVAMVSAQQGSGTEDALDRQAESYADDVGVSVEEAKRRLRLQEEIGELGESLAGNESETFGGLWTEHLPKYRVVVAFTESGAETLSRYDKSSELADAIQVVDVDVTLAALLGVQNAVDASTGRTSVLTESAVIVKDNAVEVYAVDADELEDALDGLGETLPAKVVVKEVEHLSTPAHGSSIHGGEHLSNCTSGFAVQEVIGYEDEVPIHGDMGITTAGHCPDQLSRGSTTLQYEDGDVGGSVDVQWHTAGSAYTVDNVLSFSGSYHLPITSERHRSFQNPGDHVCKYGKTSGFGCGWIVTTSHRPSWGGYSWNNTFIRVRNDNVSLAERGDSGGPWYSGHTAYGTASAWYNRGGVPRPPNEAIYMAINYLTLEDLDLLTD